MSGSHRALRILLTLSLSAMPLGGTVLASDTGPQPPPARMAVSSSPPSVELAAAQSPFIVRRSILIEGAPQMDARNGLAARQWGYHHGYGHHHGNGGAQAAIILGSAAAIAGTALLVYANRPECSGPFELPSGCGYGTKVVGGSLLAGGLVAITIGAVTWH